MGEINYDPSESGGTEVMVSETHATNLTISVPSEADVGDTIEISGALTDAETGEALAAMSIYLLKEDVETGDTDSTNSYGEYIFSYTIVESDAPHVTIATRFKGT